MSGSVSPLLAVVFAALCCSLLLRALIPRLRLRLLDMPNARSSHSLPTPRGGGLAFVLVAAVASCLGLWLTGRSLLVAAPAMLLPLVALPLAIVGVLDDLYNLPATWRYFVHIATALALILFSPLPMPWLALPLLMIAVTAVINFINFMDGLDGLVLGCMALSLSAIAIELESPWPIWALVGSLLSFALWNWSPAKVFMGDVGSTFLGAVFVGLVLQAPSWSEALGLLLVATPLLADACLCVPRRLLARQPVFQAHRLHLFQRLHQAGWSHAQVSSLYIGATAALAIALLWAGSLAELMLAALELGLGFWLDQRVAVPFTIALAKTSAHQPVVSQ